MGDDKGESGLLGILIRTLLLLVTESKVTFVTLNPYLWLKEDGSERQRLHTKKGNIKHDNQKVFVEYSMDLVISIVLGLGVFAVDDNDVVEGDARLEGYFSTWYM